MIERGGMHVSRTGPADVVIPHIFAQYPGLIAAMSTRSGGVSPEPLGMNVSFNVGDDPANVRENRIRFLGRIGAADMKLATTAQVHGDCVMHVEEGGNYPSCDALVASGTGILLAISVADCVPVLLYDPVAGVVAAVHAGWRGTRQRIIVRAIGSLVATFGTHPSDIRAYIGPAAGVCCYEVGEEVAALFSAAFLERSTGTKPRLDVKGANRTQLIESGVEPGHIEISGDCTICSAQRYHSHRRDGSHSGRMWGVIGLT